MFKNFLHYSTDHCYLNYLCAAESNPSGPRTEPVPDSSSVATLTAEASLIHGDDTGGPSLIDLESSGVNETDLWTRPFSSPPQPPSMLVSSQWKTYPTYASGQQVVYPQGVVLVPHRYMAPQFGAAAAAAYPMIQPYHIQRAPTPQPPFASSVPHHLQQQQQHSSRPVSQSTNHQMSSSASQPLATRAALGTIQTNSQFGSGTNMTLDATRPGLQVGQHLLCLFIN